eukprot:5860297-Lingulodinium_polyedra.AAC.1
MASSAPGPAARRRPWARVGPGRRGRPSTPACRAAQAPHVHCRAAAPPAALGAHRPALGRPGAAHAASTPASRWGAGRRGTGRARRRGGLCHVSPDG